MVIAIIGVLDILVVTVSWESCERTVFLARAHLEILASATLLRTEWSNYI